MNFEFTCTRARTRHFDGNFASALHLDREKSSQDTAIAVSLLMMVSGWRLSASKG